jgi:hypothetical protein
VPKNGCIFQVQMHTIKTKSGRKYHTYSLLDELPPLTEQTLTARGRHGKLVNNRRLAQATREMSLHHQYLYMDMQEGMCQPNSDNMFKLLEK